MYQCDSHQCIDLTLRCDGKPDCPFGEDETSCCKRFLNRGSYMSAHVLFNLLSKLKK